MSRQEVLSTIKWLFKLYRDNFKRAEDEKEEDFNLKGMMTAVEDYMDFTGKSFNEAIDELGGM